jgi:putative ABC transport system substrate-binding protein
MGQIIENFTADKVDLMVGVATPVAMAMQSATDCTGTPVVFAAFQTRLHELVASLEHPAAT